MTDERRHPDEVSDPVVSNTYREMSSERAPEHLDHLVLNEARNAAKQRHRSAMAWLRPAAWVTTIGLCLAIVLEVADLPLQQAGDLGDTAKRERHEPLESAESMPAPARAESGEAYQSTVEPLPATTPGPIEPSRAAAGRTRADAEDAAAQPGGMLERKSLNAPAAIEVDPNAERRFMQEAEDRALLQAGSDELDEDVPLPSSSALGVASDPSAERHCNEPQIADPDDWLGCILELEKRGLHEAALLERELLEEAFPEFPARP